VKLSNIISEGTHTMTKILNIMLAVFMIAHCVHAADDTAKARQYKSKIDKVRAKLPRQFDDPAAESLFKFMWQKGGEAIKKAEYAENVDPNNMGYGSEFVPSSVLFKYEKTCVQAFNLPILHRAYIFEGESTELPASVSVIVDKAGSESEKKNPIKSENSKIVVSLECDTEKSCFVSLFFKKLKICWPQIESNNYSTSYFDQNCMYSRPIEQEKNKFWVSPQMRAALIKQHYDYLVGESASKKQEGKSPETASGSALAK
jgi:hypothetical protein